MSVQGIFRGLADTKRPNILRVLATGDKSIAEVAEHFDITHTAVKKHLQTVKQGELISARTEGRTRVRTRNPRILKRAEDWLLFSAPIGTTVLVPWLMPSERTTNERPQWPTD